MLITAGKTILSRYDSRVPVHIGVAFDADCPALALCSKRPVAPVRGGSKIDITCARCVAQLSQLAELMQDETNPVLTVAS